ncbi:MAG: PDZ domain-containing protein [Chloroflexota bacterium]|nr:MAG: PDZ domain-containing protein [Chloroflexota bacterium]
MKKRSYRRVLLVIIGLLAVVGLIVISAAASVLAYRQFVDRDNDRIALSVDGLQVDDSQDSSEGGVVILRVEQGSPAEQAGLTRGAVIVSVNGRVVNSPDELKEAIGQYEVGDTVTLTIRDGAEKQDVAVTLAETGPYLGVNVVPSGGVYRFHAEGHEDSPHDFAFPRIPGPRHFPNEPEGMPFEFPFGEFDFDEFDFEHAPFFENFASSAFVMSVVESSPAAEAGLLPGDAIVEMDGQAIQSRQDLIDAVAESSPGDKASLQVERGEETLAVEVTLGNHPEDDGRAYLGLFLAPGLMHRQRELFQDQSNS